MEIKERLLKIISHEKVSSSAFADTIGVQRSSISHIISGRNKPSLDFLQKILSSYPKYSAEWLIVGQGEMLKRNNISNSQIINNAMKLHTSDNNLFSNLPKTEIRQEDNIGDKVEEKIENKDAEDNNNALLHSITDNNLSQKQKAQQIDRIIWFYTDGTYKEFKPNID